MPNPSIDELPLVGFSYAGPLIVHTSQRNLVQYPCCCDCGLQECNFCKDNCCSPICCDCGEDCQTCCERKRDECCDTCCVNNCGGDPSCEGCCQTCCKECDVSDCIANCQACKKQGCVDCCTAGDTCCSPGDAVCDACYNECIAQCCDQCCEGGCEDPDCAACKSNCETNCQSQCCVAVADCLGACGGSVQNRTVECEVTDCETSHWQSIICSPVPGCDCSCESQRQLLGGGYSYNATGTFAIPFTFVECFGENVISNRNIFFPDCSTAEIKRYLGAIYSWEGERSFQTNCSTNYFSGRLSIQTLLEDSTPGAPSPTPIVVGFFINNFQLFFQLETWPIEGRCSDILPWSRYPSRQSFVFHSTINNRSWYDGDFCFIGGNPCSPLFEVSSNQCNPGDVFPSTGIIRVI